MDAASRTYLVFRDNKYLGKMSETEIINPDFPKPRDAVVQTDRAWAAFVFKDGRWRPVSPKSFTKEIKAWVLLLT